MKIKDNRKENNRITVILGILCGLFIIPIIYMSYFQIIKAEDIKDHYSNRRIWAGEEQILRGSIMDRDGKVLAYSERDADGNQSRVYNYGPLYGHVIGYSYRTYGRAGLEDRYNSKLLNLRERNPIEELQEMLRSGEEKHGLDLKLTIDHGLQEKAYELLGESKGSIAMMNPKTGEVYAMASSPAFDPTKMHEEWEHLVENQDSPLLNRVTSGRYPPGSVFKILTATGIIEELNPNDIYNCTGATTVDGYTFKNYGGRAHGAIDLSKAFRDSTNTYFVDKALELGERRIKDLASRYMMNKDIPFDLNVSRSYFPDDSMEKTDLGASAIGQGRVLMTPLNMLLMTSAIANDGDMVKPILVSEVRDHEGLIEEAFATELISKVTSPEVARELREYMVGVVESGTGRGAKIQGVRVAGKTGTAENETPNAHAWFTGFAPAEDPEFVVVVMLEYAGATGGSVAAPVAKTMLEEALNTVN